MTTRRTALQGLAAGLASACLGESLAQDDRSPINILVGAASSMDATARLIAEQFRETLNRPAVVVSRLGAGQRIAIGEAKRAAPDGRTLVFATSGPFTVYPHIYTKLDYDPVADFTPIAGISYFDVAIATGPMTGATDLRQLMDWQRARRTGDAVFGSAPGNGSLSHFVGISTSIATKVPMTHVPYKDSGVGIVDLAAGRLPMMITGLQPLIELHKAGKIKLLAVSGDVRSPLVPEVPTLKEAGVNVVSSTYTGLFGPAKMSPELVKRLHDAIVPALSVAATREKLTQLAMSPWPVNGQQMATTLVEERNRFEGLVKAIGYQKENA